MDLGGAGAPEVAQVRTSGRRRWPLFAAVAVVAVSGLGLGGVVLLDDDSAGVVLEPAGRMPDEPFLDDLVATTSDDGDGEIGTGDAPPEPRALDDPVLLAGGLVVGTDPGVYAGTRDQPTCDLERLVELLTDESETARADAWFAALGQHVDDRAGYLDELTAVRLRFDTRVTAHDNERRYDAVLQAGTPVLIDRFGIPRVRCAGGAPLDEPQTAPSGTSAGDSVDAGAHAGNGDDAWGGFDPAAVVVVSGGPTADAFDLADPAAGELFTRPVGSDGDRDRGYWSGPAEDECEGCHDMQIAVETVSGTPARLTYDGGGPPFRETGTELIWLGDSADPGLFTYTVTHTYVHYSHIDPDEGPAPFYDDPRYEDEELVVDSVNLVVTECVPGDVTITITVDDVEVESTTETVPCMSGTTFTYTLE